MDGNHPITPPDGLVREWANAAAHEFDIAIQAARWGADMELEACCDWFQEFYKTESWVKHDLKHFRHARRPKPLSLKAQALEALDSCSCDEADSWKLIRRALEQLDD